METKAHGYYRQAGSAQAGQAVTTRHEYDSAVQAAADTVLIARLLAGHRLVPHLTRLIENGTQPLGNYDVVCDGVTLLNDRTAAAATFADTALTNSAAIEALGVSDEDRDISLLINSGFATAPAGGKIILLLTQVPEQF